MPDPVNFNFNKDITTAKAGVLNFVLFDEKQWAYLQRRYGLTLRERQVIKRVCKGYRNREIAKDINIALSTVKTHIRNIYRKTQTRSKIAVLLRFLYDIKFLEKEKPTIHFPVAEIKKSSNINSPETGKAKLIN